MEITKELFVCDDILNVDETNTKFECETETIETESGLVRFISSSTYEEFISCDTIEGGCPGITPFDLPVAISKDIAISSDASNLIDFVKTNYHVNYAFPPEGSILKGITDNEMSSILIDDGPHVHIFSTFNAPFGIIDINKTVLELKIKSKMMGHDETISYTMSLTAEGDCHGTISTGEIKECIVKGFIHSGDIQGGI